VHTEQAVRSAVLAAYEGRDLGSRRFPGHR